MRRTAHEGGQALVELSLVIPVLLLLATGAVAIVQLARTEMAMSSAATSAALVAARAPDAADACQSAHRQLGLAAAESGGLLPGPLRDLLRGTCVGPVPVLRPGWARPLFAIWLGYGGAGDTFCRRGGPAVDGVTDGDVVVSISYRPDLRWIPLAGSWISPTLNVRSVQKVDPFRSRDPARDPTGDDC